jgi:hypothetical protein
VRMTAETPEIVGTSARRGKQQEHDALMQVIYSATYVPRVLVCAAALVGRRTFCRQRQQRREQCNTGMITVDDHDGVVTRPVGDILVHCEGMPSAGGNKSFTHPACLALFSASRDGFRLCSCRPHHRASSSGMLEMIVPCTHSLSLAKTEFVTISCSLYSTIDKTLHTVEGRRATDAYWTS